MKFFRPAITSAVAALSLSIIHQSKANDLELYGYAKEDYTVGESLYDSGFTNKDDWVIQIEKNDADTIPVVKFKNDTFNAYIPTRGCTAWLQQKFEGPIIISYSIKCPKRTLSFPDIQARDINNFWHVTDNEEESSLFDYDRYNGSFGSYHKMHGYYASTGGGGNEGNHTTRFRRYPRNFLDNSPAPHIALNDRDENPEYLITPGKWHSVQLIAANGIAQYIVDGKIVYQIKEGDSINVEQVGEPVVSTTYTHDEFSIHNSGYFGLRLVKSHHIYKDLAIHQLEEKSLTDEH